MACKVSAGEILGIFLTLGEHSAERSKICPSLYFISLQLQFVLGVAVYSNLSSGKLTSYIQTQHLKKKKEKKKKEKLKKKEKRKKQISSLFLDFEVSPQNKRNTPF